MQRHSKLMWGRAQLKTLPIHRHVAQDAETSKASNAAALGRHLLAVQEALESLTKALRTGVAPNGFQRVDNDGMGSHRSG